MELKKKKLKLIKIIKKNKIIRKTKNKGILIIEVIMVIKQNPAKIFSTINHKKLIL